MDKNIKTVVVIIGAMAALWILLVVLTGCRLDHPSIFSRHPTHEAISTNPGGLMDGSQSWSHLISGAAGAIAALTGNKAFKKWFKTKKKK